MPICRPLGRIFAPMRRTVFLFTLELLTLAGPLRAQQPAAPARTTTAPATAAPGDSLTGPASDRYRRGAIGRFFYGKHYRPTWEMPVTAPAFRPARLFGGLKPVKEGGSMQTLNLRLVDPRGHQYVLRSVDKDLTRALPEKERNGLKARLLQDQTSAVHPYGALVAAELTRAAGVRCATPKLYRVPTDENALGEFQEAFAGRLVYLEERPDGDWRGTGAFRNADRIGSSGQMLRHRYATPGTEMAAPAVDVNGLPARAYLRARLLDMLLGDWSRREDQWRWVATTETNQTPRYYPVPRDRDHAFARYADGVVPAVGVLFKREVTSFGPKIESVRRYVHSSETLDRVLLGWLSEVDYKAEADSLTRRLSDAAIDRALTRWPANVQRLDGRRFRQALQQRRNQLPAKAVELYRYLAREVWLPGTDGPDAYTLTADGANLTITWVGRLDSAGRNGASTYARTFKPAETKHVRIFALGGADVLTLSGQLPKTGPRVEFFDGPGRDEARRTGGGDTPRYLTVRPAGDDNRFESLPDWAKKKRGNVEARDFDAHGFLLRHRL